MFIKSSALCLIGAIFSQLPLSSFAASTGSLEARLESRQTSITSITIVEFIDGWARIPAAFAAVQSTLEGGVSVQAALDAVKKLDQDVQDVITKYGTCNSCGAVKAEYVAKIKEIIENSYKSWGKIIQAAQKNYPTQWKALFTPAFQPLVGFVQATKSVSSALHIDLAALLTGIGLNLNLFLSININLNALLNISIEPNAA